MPPPGGRGRPPSGADGEKADQERKRGGEVGKTGRATGGKGRAGGGKADGGTVSPPSAWWGELSPASRWCLARRRRAKLSPNLALRGCSADAPASRRVASHRFRPRTPRRRRGCRRSNCSRRRNPARRSNPGFRRRDSPGRRQRCRDWRDTGGTSETDERGCEITKNECEITENGGIWWGNSDARTRKNGAKMRAFFRNLARKMPPLAGGGDLRSGRREKRGQRLGRRGEPGGEKEARREKRGGQRGRAGRTGKSRWWDGVPAERMVERADPGEPLVFGSPSSREASP